MEFMIKRTGLLSSNTSFVLYNKINLNFFYTYDEFNIHGAFNEFIDQIAFPI